MKKFLIVLYVLFSVNLLSQTIDTIILKTGEIIPCQIHEVSKSGLVTYYYINSNGDSAISQRIKTSIKEIRYSEETAQRLIKDNPLSLIFYPLQTGSQEDHGRLKLYTTWIRTMDNYRIKNLYIYEVKEEGITVVAKNKYKKGMTVGNEDLTDIAVTNIRGIYTRRKGSVSLGLFTGGLVGAVIGAGVGVIVAGGLYFEDIISGIPIAGLGVIGGIVGIGIGTHLGKSGPSFHIKGNQASFDEVRQKLVKRSIRYYY